MTNRGYCLATAVACILLFVGCSGSTQMSGTAPTVAPQAAGTPHGGTQLWGLWHCFMNSQGQIEAVPLRGATFTANVNSLLESKPGNLLITDLDLTNYFVDGRLNCTVTLKHPFPGLFQYDGFDVWGVFLHNGSTPIGYDGLLYSDGSGEDEARLLNPDGYMRWFNQPEFDGNGAPILEFWPGKLSSLPMPTATLNPYRIFADNLGPEEDYYDWINVPEHANDRGIFQAGGVNSRRYQLQFPMVGGAPKLDFQYAVMATWEPGDPTLTGDPASYDPGDFPTNANAEEAFFVYVTTVGTDLYNDGQGEAGGAFRADVEVFDWQGGIEGHHGVPNEVNRMILNGDFLPGGTHEFSQSELMAIAAPATENSSVFQVEIKNCVPKAGGDTGFWVVVEAASQDAGTYYQGFPTMYPDPAHRAAFLHSTVYVNPVSPFLPVVYNLVIDIERDTNNLITGIILDWDDNVGITGYNIYRQDPFDPGDDWTLLPASPLAVSQYADHDIVGNEGYQYLIIGLIASLEMQDKSVEGYALLENAEDNVNTHSVWDTCAFPIMYNPGYLPQSLFNEFAPLPETAQNGTYCWDESGLENNPIVPPNSYWTGSATLLASPLLPLPAGADTCEAEFCVRLNNMWPGWAGDQCGTAVGVTNVATDGPNNPFMPTDDYIEGLDYNLPHIQGLSNYGNFTNITTANDRGHGTQYPAYQVIQYAYSKFALPDVFTIPNARAAFAWGCGNSAGGTNIPNAGTSFDDIAILVY